MNKEITSDQLQPAEQASRETNIKTKKNKNRRQQRKKILKLEDLTKGDILRTREYVVQLNNAEEGDNGSYRLHCAWGHCTADFSKDYFMDDWIECLPEYIIKLWPQTKRSK